MQIFTRAEIDFWCNFLKNDPLPLLAAVAQAKAAGEPITVNELRRRFTTPWGAPYPDHADPAVGNSLISGDAAPNPQSPAYVAEIVARAEFTKAQLEKNNLNAASDPLYLALVSYLDRMNDNA